MMVSRKSFKKENNNKEQCVNCSGRSVGIIWNREIFFWLCALVGVTWFLIFFSGISWPFVAGFILAYFLNPIAQFLEKIGFSRLLATIFIILVVFFIFILGFIIIVPILSSQLIDFIINIPEYFKEIQEFISRYEAIWFHEYTGIDIGMVQGSLSSFINQFAEILKSLLPSLWSSGKTVAYILMLCVMVPVITFYLLLDWEKMVVTVDSWIPRVYLSTIRDLSQQVNCAISGFVRGQGAICLILGSYYTIMLTLSGLKFSLLIGLFIGLITFIPYIGFIIGLVLSVSLAWTQYWPQNAQWIVVVIAIFFLGQFLESYILQPRLIGSSIGLHPVWLMFSLFAFGSLFGFTGMLLAIPSSAAIGVIVRFALTCYLASSLYHRSKRVSNRN